MDIRKYKINATGNEGAQELPAGWCISVHELHISNDTTYFAACTYLNDTFSEHVKCIDITKDEMFAAYSSVSPEAACDAHVLALLETKYGAANVSTL